VALKVVKSAQHYTETALDEIKLLRCVSVSLFIITCMSHAIRMLTLPAIINYPVSSIGYFNCVVAIVKYCSQY